MGAGNPASALVRLGRAVEDDTDGTDDPEEKRRRIEAKVEAENFGYLAGAAIGIGVAIAEHLSEQQQAPEQPEEPMSTDEPTKTASTEEPEQNPAAQLTSEELEALEILEQEEYNEYQAQSDLWQMTM